MILILSLSPAEDRIYYIKNFEAGGLYRVAGALKSAGGKGVNAARVASALGAEIVLAGFKAGETGNWIEKQAAGLKRVRTEFLEVCGETRTNNNIIDKESGTETEILEAGPKISAGEAAKMTGLLTAEMAGANVVVCTGGLPEGMEPDYYANVIKSAAKKGVRAILDTSGEMLVKGVKAFPFMVKPNRRELGAYAGMDINGVADAVKASELMLSHGASIVTASLGPDGAVMSSHDWCFEASSPDIDVVNTIGSGDSMVAGLAAAVDRILSGSVSPTGSVASPPGGSNSRDTDGSLSQSIDGSTGQNACGFRQRTGQAGTAISAGNAEEMLRLGMACALANTQFEDIGRVEPEMVERYLPMIKIRRLS